MIALRLALRQVAKDNIILIANLIKKYLHRKYRGKFMSKKSVASAAEVKPTLQQQLDGERRLVSFDSYDLSVRQLLEMFESGEIEVPPEYQRQFIWGADRESQLIESVLLGIPVPSLFMATNAD